uniref:Uncharacterized protein n=1 Tax=viral metagenome TaxID=1070528 RepID=A0A6C0EE47_9ZZZZ
METNISSFVYECEEEVFGLHKKKKDIMDKIASYQKKIDECNKELDICKTELNSFISGHLVKRIKENFSDYNKYQIIKLYNEQMNSIDHRIEYAENMPPFTLTDCALCYYGTILKEKDILTLFPESTKLCCQPFRKYLVNLIKTSYIGEINTIYVLPIWKDMFVARIKGCMTSEKTNIYEVRDLLIFFFIMTSHVFDWSYPNDIFKLSTIPRNNKIIYFEIYSDIDISDILEGLNKCLKEANLEFIKGSKEYLYELHNNN